MSHAIDDAATLQERIGKLSGPRDIKVIDHLDAHAIAWIAASPLLFIGAGDQSGIDLTAGGGDAGFVQVHDPRLLSLPLDHLDAPQPLRTGQGVGTLLLVPGIGETLRVNGRIVAIADGRLHVAVQECYLHCAKALIRSEFWAAGGDSAALGDVADAIAQVRFMALATIDADGHADLSPKGDPSGLLLQGDVHALCYPDRPGNRRVDSFRNILQQPTVALLALLPGSPQLLHVRGRARVSDDPQLRARFAVDARVPNVVTCIEDIRIGVHPSQAVQRARLWPVTGPVPALDPAAIFRDHVRLNRMTGLQATLVRTAVSVPGLMRRGLDSDYKKNLY